MRAFFPFMNISPLSRRFAPLTSSIVSLLPEPTSPAKPSISPRCSLKLTCSTLLPVRSRASSSTSPGSVLRDGKLSVSSRPTIRLTSSGRFVSSVLIVFMNLPSRGTLMRSVIWNTSSMRCEMYMTVTPRSLSLRIIENSSSTSWEASGAVGSSIIIIFALFDIALAISTSCWFAGESRCTLIDGSRSKPYSSNSSRASAFSLRLLYTLPILRPIKMFSATVIGVTRFMS